MTISQQIAKQRARRKQNEAARRKKFENAKLVAKKATRAKALNSRANSKILQNLNTLQELEQKLAELDLSVANKNRITNESCVASENCISSENCIASEKHGVGVASENCVANKNRVSSKNRVASENPLDLSVANENCVSNKNCATNKKHNLPLANKSHNENQGENQNKIQANEIQSEIHPLDLSAFDENYQALANKARFYALHCIVNFGTLDEFAHKKYYKFDTLAKFLGFSHLCDDFVDFESKKTKRKNVLEFCKERLTHLSALKEQGKLGEHKILQKNLALLKTALNLNEAELCLLEFIVIKEEVAAFKEFLETYDDLSRRECAMVLSQITALPYKEMQKALSRGGVLANSGILDYATNGDNLIRYLRFDDDNFTDILLEPCKDKNALIDKIIAPCDKCTLGKDDYAHFKEFTQLQDYVASAVSQGKGGANVLLYGSAGTGKTELAKLLARGAKARLYKVKTSDEDGDAVDGVRRFGSYLLAQRLLEPKKSLLLYDEAEDILHISHFDERMNYKAFVNEKLESNAVLTIWITNKISSVDKAVLRRFDFIVEAKMPKKAHKERIINKICGEKLDEKAMKFALKSRALSPAIIERASRVSEQLKGDFSSNFTMLAKNTLKASASRDFFWGKLKKKSKFKDAQNELPQSYSLEFINADYDLSTIAKGIEKNPNARLCLYGASGTGKSAYARFLAQKLGRKCLVRTASDLLDCWLGSTEKLIAAAFKEAKKKNAVLIFDEVDSFLRDRKLAVRSWEQTQVNEMLVQMESFDGVFIATTNLMEGLDKASLRRFDLKLEFKVLTPLQRVKLFEKECELLGISCENEALAKINRLENLSAGDFAAVKRLIKFSPLKDDLDFYERLADEVKVKDLEASTKAGFSV